MDYFEVEEDNFPIWRWYMLRYVQFSQLVLKRDTALLILHAF